MKKILILLGVLAIVALGYLGAAHLSGGAFFAFGLPLGGDRGELRRTALEFLEDVQFKDFNKASSYHSPTDQKTVDIPFLLRSLFKVKHEALDIMDFEIVFAKIDSSGNRARVKVRMKAKILVQNKIREQPLMLYFSRRNEKSPWYMHFEDSLRSADEQDGKKR